VSVGPSRDERRRSRASFWLFAAVMAVAVAGGGVIVVLARQSVAARKGHPDTVSPAESRAAATPSGAAGVGPGAERPAASSRDPEGARRLFREAERRRAEHDLDGAIALYLAAEAADPELSEVHERLARCHQLQGDGRRAAERYRRYLATDPEDAARVRAILSTLP
jgi:tetratricopeptide (TPR) repeat protein